MSYSEKKANKIIEFAEEKNAMNPELLDLREVSNFCDFFVIFTGTSKTHSQAIADGIMRGMKATKEKISHKDGYQDLQWIVLDYQSVIVHIFDEETRQYYDLERLWGEYAQEK